MNTFTIAFIAIYAVINVITFLVYGNDKKKAINGEWRTTENTLIGLAAIGPIGGALGMKVFHHKTQKPKFLLIYVFLIIHIAVIAYLVYIGKLSF